MEWEQQQQEQQQASQQAKQPEWSQEQWDAHYHWYGYDDSWDWERNDYYDYPTYAANPSTGDWSSHEWDYSWESDPWSQSTVGMPLLGMKDRSPER